MKGHVVQGSWRWPAFEQCDRDVVISDGNAAIKLKLFSQTQRALEPFRAAPRITNGQSEVTDNAQGKRNFHGNINGLCLETNSHSRAPITLCRCFNPSNARLANMIHLRELQRGWQGPEGNR